MASVGQFDSWQVRRQPQWRFGDVVRGLLMFFVSSSLGLAFGLFAVGRVGLDQLRSGEPTSAAVVVFVCMVGAQALVLLGWPAFVSLSKGNGLGPDFGWRIAPIDVPIGVGVGLANLALVYVVVSLMGIGFDVDPWAGPEVESSGAQLSAGLWLAIVITVVVVAPVTEELFFRGLMLRTFERFVGIGPAVVLSAFVFALLHVAAPDLAWASLTLAAIFIGGLVFAVVTVVVGRLGPAIIAHGVYNAGILIQAAVFD